MASSFSSANTKPETKRGRLFIVSAPSGAGKTTLCREILRRFPDMRYSVSYTTRMPRAGETDGIDYHFVSTEQFIAGIQEQRWAEWACVYGNYYGTSAEFIDFQLKAGSEILLDIDVQGALQIIRRYPDCITIFIMPPSLDILRNRLESRGADNRQVIEKRLGLAADEMEQKHLYRHIIVNDRLPDAIDQLVNVIEIYGSRQCRTD